MICKATDIFLIMNTKNILILYAILFNCTAIAQTDPMDNFWKDVEKRKAQKQSSEGLSEEYYNKLLSACGMEIIILQQEYIYELKNKRYVRGNGDYYGRKFGIGVRTKQGIVSSKHLNEPWKSDTSSLPEKGYIPVKTSVKYKSLKDLHSTSFEEGKYSISSGDHLIRYTFGQVEKSEDVIQQPDSIGLLMLFFRDHQADTVSRKIVKYRPIWKEGASMLDTQWVNKSLTGGVFVNVDTTDGGTDYILTGILSDDLTSGFMLYKLTELIQKKVSGKSGTSGGFKNTSSRAVKKVSTSKGNDLSEPTRQNNEEIKKE